MSYRLFLSAIEIRNKYCGQMNLLLVTGIG